MPDPELGFAAQMTSGVRLAFRTDAQRIELDLEETGLRRGAGERLAVRVDLLIDGGLYDRQPISGGPTLHLDNSTSVHVFHQIAGRPSTVCFAHLPKGFKDVEIWLPHTAATELHDLRLPLDAYLQLKPANLPRWSHYGSSISHGMEADGPSETWPAIAARLGGLNLMSLGFAGQCHIDGMVARALAESCPDVISLKLGANIVSRDSMRERAFVPAVDSFLDLIRERLTAVPVLVVSPIICPAAESQPGPILPSGKQVRVPHRPKDLATGALSMGRIRDLLTAIVDRRRSHGDLNLHYLDGRQLFGAADVGDLRDGLHPNGSGLRRIGERFAELALGPGKPLAL
jgi:hypothetical protein